MKLLSEESSSGHVTGRGTENTKRYGTSAPHMVARDGHKKQDGNVSDSDKITWRKH